MALPEVSWASYEISLKKSAEGRVDSNDAKQRRFLRELSLVTDELTNVTPSGSAYFRARFIDEDFTTATAILQSALLNYAPAAAIVQLLFGVPNSTRAKAESVLRHHGYRDELSDRKLRSLLSIMHTADLVEYDSKAGLVRVVFQPAGVESAPQSVFVSPQTPYGNKAWLRRILSESTGYLYWLDKHFMPIAFDALWEALDGSNVAQVKVLSLRMTEHEGRRPLRAYRDLVAELKNRGIDFKWHTIDSTLVRGTHDRWIISDGRARNVPNVGAIYSGQHSEMSASSSVVELTTLFESYWEQSKPFDQPT